MYWHAVAIVAAPYRPRIFRVRAVRMIERSWLSRAWSSGLDVGGLLSFAGALTYEELGASSPGPARIRLHFAMPTGLCRASSLCLDLVPDRQARVDATGNYGIRGCAWGRFRVSFWAATFLHSPAPRLLKYEGTWWQSLPPF